MTDLTTEIREIYQQWLDGGLSQEDALFSIGDALDEARPHGQRGLEGAGTWPAGTHKAS